MLRFFSRKELANRSPIGSGSEFFRVLPAGRASIHADGAVFLNVERGVIFKSNRLGSRIWQGVQNQESPAAMAAEISREYRIPQQQAAEDTAQFLNQLEAEGFLVHYPFGSRA